MLLGDGEGHLRAATKSENSRFLLLEPEIERAPCVLGIGFSIRIFGTVSFLQR